MVWDKTPDHAKKRWKDAHDRIIEGSSVRIRYGTSSGRVSGRGAPQHRPYTSGIVLHAPGDSMSRSCPTP